ncbi:MAG: MotA/TolQ/ExbB proton channel family protein [Verrucomicrobia bacterium]|nr:MotA/TolQ/ExbB proton channel family protein [Verrucomicrobiota bacterium]
MTSKNKGFLSLEFLVPIFAFVTSVVSIHFLYKFVVTPRAHELELRRSVLMKQGAIDSSEVKARSVFLVIKDLEPQFEIVFTFWGLMILGYKMAQVQRERAMFKHDLLRLHPGERVIPEDALDRYKEIKNTLERRPEWRDRLLAECQLAALHRFHATSSIQDAANAVRERAELAADHLDSGLGLVRYIAWAIPAIGFIGTVRGIGDALTFAEQAIKGDISAVTTWLGLAFNSTFVGLALCIVLMFVLHLVQGLQESLVIDTQTHCRDKLIDLMKVPTKEESATFA